MGGWWRTLYCVLILCVFGEKALVGCEAGEHASSAAEHFSWVQCFFSLLSDGSQMFLKQQLSFYLSSVSLFFHICCSILLPVFPVPLSLGITPRTTVVTSPCPIVIAPLSNKQPFSTLALFISFLLLLPSLLLLSFLLFLSPSSFITQHSSDLVGEMAFFFSCNIPKPVMFLQHVTIATKCIRHAELMGF